MADNKKQHFVPKLLLKNFINSNNEIGMVSVDKPIKKMFVDYKTQCQKTYFYGEDLELEEKFGGVESVLSNIIKTMLDNYWVPVNKLGTNFGEDKISEIFNNVTENTSKKSKESQFIYYWFLLYFCFLQEYRTPKFKSRSDALYTQIIKGIIKRDEKIKNKLLLTIEKNNIDKDKHLILEEFINYLKVSNDNTFKKHFNNVRKATNENIHLTFKLLVNCSGKSSFIISDHPCFLHGDIYKNITGIKFLLPLSPIVCLIAYDSKICKIGLKKQHSVVVSEYQDILNINLIQYLHCQKNVYFNENYDLQELYEVINKYKSERENPPEITLDRVNGDIEYKLDKERPFLKFTFLKKIN